MTKTEKSQKNGKKLKGQTIFVGYDAGSHSQRLLQSLAMTTIVKTNKTRCCKMCFYNNYGCIHLQVYSGAKCYSGAKWYGGAKWENRGKMIRWGKSGGKKTTQKWEIKICHQKLKKGKTAFYFRLKQV